MTYQFDPKPEGLHYEPVQLSLTRRKLWYLRDRAPHPWIDLRSICEIIGMRWSTRWFIAHQAAWGLEACTDRKARETLLAPANHLAAVLGTLQEHLYKKLQTDAADKLHQVRLQWRSRLNDAIASGNPAQSSEASSRRASSPRQAKRRVDAYVVTQAFRLLKKRYSKAEIAKALNVSIATISALASGTYKCPDADTQATWARTFGAENASPPV